MSEGIVCNSFAAAGPCGGDGVTSPGGLAAGQLPGGNPGPNDDHNGVAAPEVGLIVKWNEAAGEFQDGSGRNWTNGVRFTRPDRDVFAIDVATLSESAFHTGVGTILFNMIANPTTGKLYVSNTEAGNLTRFEGPGLHGGSTVQGDLARSQFTIIDSPCTTASPVTPRHLNKHIDYTVLPAPAGGKDDSLATPADMAISADGAMLYVAAFGSSKLGVFDTTMLENDSFVPSAANHLSVSGGGPGDLAFYSDLAPIVGQQVTLSSTNAAVAEPRIDLFIQRAGATFVSQILGGTSSECDLIAKGFVAGSQMGWGYTGGGIGTGTFDASDGTTTTDSALRALAGGRISPSPACRRDRASAWASIKIATFTSTAMTTVPAYRTTYRQIPIRIRSEMPVIRLRFRFRFRARVRC